MSRSQPPGLSTETARASIRATGLRGTACRIAVLRFLADAGAPLSHAEIAETLVPLGFDKSTIYRGLVEMADAGLITRLELGDHLWRFEMAAEPSGSVGGAHPHFVCLDCGKVACLPEVRVQLSPKKGRGNRTLGAVTEILLKGHCVECG